MIQFLIGLVSLLLLVVGYYLLRKQAVFLSLISNDEENKAFLSQFGSIYLFFAVLGIIVAIANDKFYAIIFLIALLCIAAVFGILFSQKMSKPN
ncbi:hypothetical protein BAU15_00230 [Enterococcus sp. JM4C]|uniref:hypothetical protein n=1 Tax=Candidatus Enterococcus huntleyi TaxID=1857217 RepID=UPI00137ABDF9|nr:hypothetical protein [Enterococcus sp. JM4C]KAF1299108.1 hypothetical protein BAU15_00230 [Enterococcus sp. JM4C]